MTTPIRRRLFHWYLKTRRFFMVSLLHANDSPHRLALGFAVGIWVAFTPTYGIQLVLIPFMAWCLGGNKTIGLIPVWITNPLTIVPIYYYSYIIGAYALGQDPKDARWSSLTVDQGGWVANFNHYWQFIGSIFVELWVGCLFVATLLALISYYTVKFCIIRYRLRKWGCIDVKMPLSAAPLYAHVDDQPAGESELSQAAQRSGPDHTRQSSE